MYKPIREIAYIAPFGGSHGEAYVNRELYKELIKHYTTYAFDTSGSMIIKKIVGFVLYASSILIRNNVKIIIISPSRRVLFLLFYLSVLALFSRRAKIYIYLHGSEFYEYASQVELKRLIGFFLKLSNVTLVVPEIKFGYTSWQQYVNGIIEIPNPISESFFKNICNEYVQRKPNFAFVSVPDKNKNIDQAIRFVLKHNANLTVVGWTENDYARLYKSKVVPDNITFVGPQSAAGVREILSKSSYLISCSDKEFQPLVVLEALICGCVPLVGRHKAYEILKNHYENIHFIDEIVINIRGKWDFRNDHLKIRMRHMPNKFQERWIKLLH